MKQMVNSQAPALEKIPFGDLVSGFFRRSCDQGGILFAGRSGGWSFVFPVFEDGSISRHGSGKDRPYPGEEISVIDPKSLGISEARLAND